MSLLLLLSETPEDQIPQLDWVCDVQDVADLLRSRLVSDDNQEQPTFNQQTYAKPAQVERLIRKAAWLVAPKIGVQPPDEFLPACRSIVALRAAMLVEASFQSDEVERPGRLLQRAHARSLGP